MFALWPNSHANEALLHSSLKSLHNVNVFTDPLGCAYSQPRTSKEASTQTENNVDGSLRSKEWKQKCRVVSLILYRSIPDYEIALDLRISPSSSHHTVTGRVIFYFLNFFCSYWKPIVFSGLTS
uniref:Uncharacterized protein n=2 Tax=Bursaphelenchus xylophilus TaxID=6326 RepID=A0A1I7S2N1_BURXY